jgi:hypothetical protein
VHSQFWMCGQVAHSELSVVRALHSNGSVPAILLLYKNLGHPHISCLQRVPQAVIRLQGSAAQLEHTHSFWIRLKPDQDAGRVPSMLSLYPRFLRGQAVCRKLQRALHTRSRHCCHSQD